MDDNFVWKFWKVLLIVVGNFSNKVLAVHFIATPLGFVHVQIHVCVLFANFVKVWPLFSSRDCFTHHCFKLISWRYILIALIYFPSMLLHFFLTQIFFIYLCLLYPYLYLEQRCEHQGTVEANMHSQGREEFSWENSRSSAD